MHVFFEKNAKKVIGSLPHMTIPECPRSRTQRFVTANPD